MKIETCSEPTCGKQFVYVESVRTPGAMVPVDVDSLSETEKQADRPLQYVPGRHVSHFKTCTKPQQFSRKR